jgi:hypothetical protein
VNLLNKAPVKVLEAEVILSIVPIKIEILD